MTPFGRRGDAALVARLIERLERAPRRRSWAESILAFWSALRRRLRGR